MNANNFFGNTFFGLLNVVLSDREIFVELFTEQMQNRTGHDREYCNLMAERYYRYLSKFKEGANPNNSFDAIELLCNKIDNLERILYEMNEKLNNK